MPTGMSLKIEYIPVPANSPLSLLGMRPTKKLMPFQHIFFSSIW
jgi:hypothetical protein